jgi:SEC-C motif-containing protein
LFFSHKHRYSTNNQIVNKWIIFLLIREMLSEMKNMQSFNTAQDHVMCFCGANSNYENCCGQFHKGLQFAPTAEALMRSRYSAYILCDSAYLLSTWYKNTRPKQLDFSQDILDWQKLEILHTKKGNVKDDKGKVEFNAFYIQDGQLQVMHEISRFKKLGGKWFYVDGILG